MSPASYRTAPPRVGVLLLYELLATKANRRDATGGVAEAGGGKASPSGMTEVVIYTDGACSGNPGPGGWGVVMSCQGKEKEMYGFDPLTTNNRMELMAAIQALEALTRPVTVSLHTDSTYVLNGITKWI